MSDLIKGHLRAFRARTPEDLDRALSLRSRSFGSGDSQYGDRFDLSCTQVLIEESRNSRLLCCFRVRTLQPDTVGQSYSAQFYDVSALKAFGAPLMELGRFCTAPGMRDPDVLRLAWAWLARETDASGVAMLFGCSSFPGTDTANYLDTFAMLNARHLAPERWRPGVRAPETFRFAALPRPGPDIRRALKTMPPLLRSYLATGGRVSDHAVIDRQLNTLHVFTGVEVRAIPSARKRRLRSMV